MLPGFGPGRGLSVGREVCELCNAISSQHTGCLSPESLRIQPGSLCTRNGNRVIDLCTSSKAHSSKSRLKEKDGKDGGAESMAERKALQRCIFIN